MPKIRFSFASHQVIQLLTRGFDDRTVLGARRSAMYERRSFLKKLSGAAASFLLLQDPPIPTPRVRTPVNPPKGEEKQNSESPTSVAPKARLQEQEKELRETAEQLFAKVGDLRTELAKTPTARVFSIGIFKQSQEIEKLAKRLKNCARA